MSRTVKTTMGRLRAKVERDPGNPDHLLTVVGAGYRFEAVDPRADEGTLEEAGPAPSEPPRQDLPRPTTPEPPTGLWARNFREYFSSKSPENFSE